jgi:hypothetical protein
VLDCWAIAASVVSRFGPVLDRRAGAAHASLSIKMKYPALQFEGGHGVRAEDLDRNQFL